MDDVTEPLWKSAAKNLNFVQDLRRACSSADCQIPEWWTDEELFRWARARVKANGQLDLEESTKMLTSHLSWRREMMLDDDAYNWEDPTAHQGLACPVLHDERAEARQRSGEFSFMVSPQYACKACMPRCSQSATEFSCLYPSSYCGVGKDGQPVYYERIGAVDWKALREIRGQDGAPWDEVFCRWVAIDAQITSRWRLLAVSLDNLNKGSPVPAIGTTVIVDFHGVSINEGRRMVGLIGKASGQAQANSPEYLSKMFIVNFPRWLTALYTTVVKPFLNARTRSKIEILEKGNYAPLYDLIASDQLPDFIPGGTVPSGMPGLPSEGKAVELDKGWRQTVRWPPSPLPSDAPHLPWNKQEILEQIRLLGGFRAAWAHVFEQARKSV